MKYRQLFKNQQFIDQVADVIVSEIKGGVGSGIRGHRTDRPASNKIIQSSFIDAIRVKEALKYLTEDDVPGDCAIKVAEIRQLDKKAITMGQCKLGGKIMIIDRNVLHNFHPLSIAGIIVHEGEHSRQPPKMAAAFAELLAFSKQRRWAENKLKESNWDEKEKKALEDAIYNSKTALRFYNFKKAIDSEITYFYCDNDYKLRGKIKVDEKPTKSHSPITKSKAKEDAFIKFTEKKEKEFQKVLNKYFIEQSGDISFSKDIGINSIIKASKNRWFFNQKKWDNKLQKIGSDYIAELYKQYGSQVFEDLKYGYPNAEILGAFDVTSPALESFIDAYSYKFATGVNTITNDAIRAIMDYGMGEGLSNTNIAKVIRELFDGYTKYRSLLIARTETIRASNGAAQEAYKQSGVVTGKQWWTAQDDRRCPFCAKLHGKIIKLDQNFFKQGDEFKVGEEVMVLDYEDVGYPPLHPACRCTVIPLVAKKYQLGISEYFTKAQGNFGHAGRPGRVGGSAARSGMIPYKQGDQLPDHLSKVRIPPAWANVLVNPNPKAAVQIVGRDVKGREQVLYSEAHSSTQAKAKFNRVKELDAKYDSIKKQNEANLKSDDKNVKEHAKVTRLIMETGIRPGSEQDTGAAKKAYGATTLEGRHVVVDGDKVSLQFVGKKGKDLNIPIDNPRIANDLIKRAKKAGSDGQLFPNVNDNSLRTYVGEFDGGGFKTKDFRTRLANDVAEKEIRKIKSPKTEKEYKKAVKAVAKSVAEKLGNTATIALQSYINPVVFGRWRSRLEVVVAKTIGIFSIMKGGPGSGIRGHRTLRDKPIGNNGEFASNVTIEKSKYSKHLQDEVNRLSSEYPNATFHKIIKETPLHIKEVSQIGNTGRFGQTEWKGDSLLIKISTGNFIEGGSPSLGKNTLRHEIGHYIEKNFERSDYDKMKELYNKHSGSSKLPSDAKTNHTEFFAESFARVTSSPHNDPHYRQVHPEMEGFIKRNILRKR